VINPANQWALQIEVTNVCPRECSNCTRFVGHAKPFWMSLEYFHNAVYVLKSFLTESPPHSGFEYKVLGLIGGEPLIHPRFSEMMKIMEEEIPNKECRGLWTGLRWQNTKYAPDIERIFGCINNNLHNTKCKHTPILVAVDDIEGDAVERKKLIDNCWLQQKWCGTVTPKGFFFCEVAGAFDWLFDGPGGLPVIKDCWQQPLSAFEDQIIRCCNCCGIPLQLEGRLDSENVDDISISNLERLQGSKRIQDGKYVLYGGNGHRIATPWVYK
jgi:hypothetical protein